jgi:hypothetical protein
MRHSLNVGLILLALCAVCLEQRPPKQQVYDLPLPRAALSSEMLVARITVGPLKPHQRIIVRTRSGEIAGTISPFGAQARQTSGIYTIPIPDSAIKDGHVRLLLQLEQKDAPTRAPTAEEVLGITLTYIPATKRGSKD